MIIAETAIGRFTRKSPVGAFSKLGNDSMGMKIGGWINAVIPILIVPYYSVIGGWVCKYLYAYLTSPVKDIADASFFTGFISDGTASEFWFIVFMLMVLVVLMNLFMRVIQRCMKLRRYTIKMVREFVDGLFI